MLLDLGAGQDRGAEGADGVHGWVEVVVFVGGPGGALFGALTQAAQAAVVFESQGDAHGEGHEVQE